MTPPLIADCKRLMDLGPGWDGYRGKPVTSQAIKACKAAYVVPGADGGVQVEWHLTGGSVEIEIGPDGGLVSVSWIKQSAAG